MQEKLKLLDAVSHGGRWAPTGGPGNPEEERPRGLEAEGRAKGRGQGRERPREPAGGEGRDACRRRLQQIGEWGYVFTRRGARLAWLQFGLDSVHGPNGNGPSPKNSAKQLEIKFNI